MPAPGSTLKSDERRRTILARAVELFSLRGYYGTATTEIAASAGVSQPYLFRLYSSKEALFAAAVAHVSDVMARTMLGDGPLPTDTIQHERFEIARDRYRALTADPIILRFLMHANCAAGEPMIGEAVRACYEKQVDVLMGLVDDADLARRWFADGMLDNVVTVLGARDSDQDWARILSSH